MSWIRTEDFLEKIINGSLSEQPDKHPLFERIRSSIIKEENIMVVQHNMQAANSNRMLGVTTSAQAKSTEKLSSGYKINRAADDAA